jgi:hypothetical protein
MSTELTDLDPRDLIVQKDFHSVAMELKRLADSGEITKAQANDVLISTPYRLEEKPIFEVVRRGE